MNDLLLLKRSDGKVLLLQRNGYSETYNFRNITFKKTNRKKKYNAGVALIYKEVQEAEEIKDDQKPVIS